MNYDIADKVFTGRKKLYTSLIPADYAEAFPEGVIITPETLVADITEQELLQTANEADVKLLLDLYRGDSPIFERDIPVETSSNNKVSINMPLAISRNLSSYTFHNGVQFVAKDAEYSDAVRILNDLFALKGQGVVTQEMKDYQSICGTTYLYINYDPLRTKGVPFTVQHLSPENTYVVYSVFDSQLPIYAVTRKVFRDKDGNTTISRHIYTHNYSWLIQNAVSGWSVVREGAHILGDVPIVEVPNNTMRLGDFEVVLPICAAINKAASDCLNNIEDVVRSILVMFGVDPRDIETNADKVNTSNILAFSGVPGINQDAKFIHPQLDGTSVAQFRAYLNESLKYVAGVPERDAANLASTTGIAEDIKTGQSDAEAIATVKATFVEAAERRILAMCLNILGGEPFPDGQKDLSVSDIDVDITRINRDNILLKSQAMLNLKAVGMSNDDIVYFGNITNDVSGVAARMTETQAAQDAQAVAEAEE